MRRLLTEEEVRRTQRHFRIFAAASILAVALLVAFFITGNQLVLGAFFWVASPTAVFGLWNYLLPPERL